MCDISVVVGKVPYVTFTKVSVISSYFYPVIVYFHQVSSLGDFADDTECLVRAEQKTCRRRASCQALPTGRELDHPAFQCIRNVQPEGQTVVTLSKLVTPGAMQQCLQFAYTGTIDRSALNLQVSSFPPIFPTFVT